MKSIIIIFLLSLLAGCDKVNPEGEAILSVVNETAEPIPIPLQIITAEPTQPQDNSPPKLSFDFNDIVETEHGPIFIQCSGMGERPVVILEAGLGNNAASWRLV